MERNIALNLWKKVILQELFQQLGVVKGRFGIDDKYLSQISGHVDNWFSGAKKNKKDIRISSFLRILAALDNSLSLNTMTESLSQKVLIGEILNDQVIWFASIYNGLKDEDEDPNENHIYYYLQERPEKLSNVKATLDGLAKEKKKLSDEEHELLYNLLILIENKKGDE